MTFELKSFICRRRRKELDAEKDERPAATGRGGAEELAIAAADDGGDGREH